ncbi:sterile alpha motif domain-containing protein 3-like, partial [Silurus asotus]
QRACVLRGLSVYLNKDENLMKEYVVNISFHCLDMASTVIAIFIIRSKDADVSDPPLDVGVIVEGVKVLHNLGDVTKPCALLLGVIYSLNLSCPSDLNYTLEFFQKVLLGLDAQKLSHKIQ